MPAIPTTQRRVQSKSFQAQNVNARMPLVGQTDTTLVDSLANVHEGYLKEQEAERKKAEQTEFDVFEIEARGEANRLSNDKKTGFLTSVKGKSTMDNFDKYTGDYDKFLEDKISKLGSDSLRERAKRAKDEYSGNLKNQFNRHTSSEMDKYSDGVFSSNLESIRNDAVLNYKEVSSDGSKVQKSLAKQAFAIEAFASRKGLSQKEKSVLLIKNSSKLHKGIIEQAINNGEDKLANRYYEAAEKRGEIDADTALSLKGILKASDIKGDSQRITDEIMSSGIGLKESLIKAREVEDPDKRDAIVNRVKNRFSENKQLKEIAVQESGLVAYNELKKFGNLDNMSPIEQQKIAPRYKKAIEKYQKAVRSGYKGGVTNPLVYEELMEMGSDPKRRAEFINTDIVKYMGDLDSADLEMFLKMRAEVKAGKTPSEKEKLLNYRTRSQIVKDTIEKIGITDKVKIGGLNQEITTRIGDFIESHGKKPTSDEIQKITDDLILKVEIEGSVYGTNTKRKFELNEKEEIVGVEFENIPTRSQVRIQEELEAQGVEFSENEVRSRFFQEEKIKNGASIPFKQIPAAFQQLLRESFKNNNRQFSESEAERFYYRMKREQLGIK